MAITHCSAQYMHLLESTKKIWMKIGARHQCKDVANDSSFWQYKVYADICGGSIEKGVLNDSGVVHNSDFQWFWLLYLRNR